MSQLVFTGRGRSRMSVSGALLAVPESMAGLPGSRSRLPLAAAANKGSAAVL